MDRLTGNELTDNGTVICNHENTKKDCNDSCMYGMCGWNKKALLKLKEYEDAEEQCLLHKNPFVTIKFSKEDMQEIVNEKVKEIELDIQAIRNNAIDDFVEKIQWEYLNGCGIKQREIEFLVNISNEVAEKLKDGGKNV